MQKQSDEYHKALMDLSFTREKYKGFSEILRENEVIKLYNFDNYFILKAIEEL